MFSRDVDAHNLIILIYKAPLPRLGFLSWAAILNKFSCKTYSKIIKQAIGELIELNSLYAYVLFGSSSKLDGVYRALDNQLGLSNLVKKFKYARQGVDFVKLLVFEYYRKDIKSLEALQVFDEIVKPIYQQMLLYYKDAKIFSGQGDFLLKRLLQQVGGEAGFNLLQQIAVLQLKHCALEPLLKNGNEELSCIEKKLSSTLTRDDISCIFTLEAPLCPVYLANNQVKQCYEFDSLNKYMCGQIDKEPKGRFILELLRIKHPICADVLKYACLPSEVSFAWSHLKLSVQQECYDLTNRSFSMAKLKVKVLEQAELLTSNQVCTLSI